MAIAKRAARDGANVVVAAKTAEPHPTYVCLTEVCADSKCVVTPISFLPYIAYVSWLKGTVVDRYEIQKVRTYTEYLMRIEWH